MVPRRTTPAADCEGWNWWVMLQLASEEPALVSSFRLAVESGVGVVGGPDGPSRRGLGTGTCSILRRRPDAYFEELRARGRYN